MSDLFATSKQLGRIPVLVVAAQSATDTTTWLNHVLSLPAFARTVLLTTTAAHQTVLTHPRVSFLPTMHAVSDSGCLCCGMDSALGDTLRVLFLQALSKKIPPIDRIVIDAAQIDTAQLKFTLRHAPFLGQRYVYHGSISPSDLTMSALMHMI